MMNVSGVLDKVGGEFGGMTARKSVVEVREERKTR